MNILVTGANGQLGRWMERLATGGNNSYHFARRADIDVTRRDVLMNYVLHNGIDCIVNCAAYTNVDKAEEEQQQADMVNHVAVAYMADAMKAVGGLLVHFSTDYVFGGEQQVSPITEDRPMSPCGAYGMTKASGDMAIMKSGCRYIIFRTSWLYGEEGHNFLKTMLRVLPEGGQRKVVFDQIGTPTYVGGLAEVVYSLLESGDYIGKEGLYNYSDEGVCSWYDFAVEIARQKGINNCTIMPCRSHEYPTAAVRPAYSVLDKTLVKQTFGVVIPHWTESLARCLDRMSDMEKQNVIQHDGNDHNVAKIE